MPSKIPFNLLLALSMLFQNGWAADAPPSQRDKKELSDAEARDLITKKGSDTERLSSIKDLSHRAGNKKRPFIGKALRDFAEEQISRKGRVSPAAERALGDSLRTIGLVGGSEETRFLIRWIREDDFLARISSATFGDSAGEAKNSLRNAAIWGLGLSGDPDALAAMRQLMANPPSGPHTRKMTGILRDAIEANQEISAIGAERYFSEAEAKKREQRLLERLRPVIEDRERRRREKQK